MNRDKKIKVEKQSQIFNKYCRMIKDMIYYEIKYHIISFMI